MKNPFIRIGKRKIGLDFSPLVVADIGINHEGSMSKAKIMIRDVAKAGGECVKFQCHVVADEMIAAAKKVIPGNAKESIWNIMERCAFSEKQDRELKAYAEKLGLIYLSTPFSRAAADRLRKMNVLGFKIGSGECNNYPLIEHIASFGKPIILSTGMNDLASIRPAVNIFRKRHTPFALLHCVSMYPTPYDKVQLGAIGEIKRAFKDAVLGLSDHSIGIYTCLGAVPLGASILEKHFTSNKNWPGPDIPVSVDELELKDMVIGSRALYLASGGKKEILKEEKPTIDFAYACVVSIKNIKAGDKFTSKNVWVKRPGTGEIRAVHYPKILGRISKFNIKEGVQLTWRDIKKS